MPTRKIGHNVWLALILLGSAALKLFFLRADRVFESYTMAMDLAATGQFGHHYYGTWDRAFQLPVHTAVLALFHQLGLGIPAMLFFQVVCGTLTAWIIHQMATHLLQGARYAPRVALVAAALTGLSPFLAYYQVRMVHPFAWDMLLATVLLYGALKIEPQDRIAVIALFALGGLAVLNRPTLGVFLLPFAWRHWRWLFHWKGIVYRMALVVLLLGPLGGWVLRNHAVTGRYWISSVADQMIWMGLQEETEGGAHMPDGKDYRSLLSPAECVLMFQMNAQERSDFFKAKWQAEVRGDRSLWWRMMVIKLRSFWLYRSHPGQDHGATMEWAIVLYRAYAIAVVLLMVAQLLVLRHRGLLIITTSVVALSVLQCVFYFETRHRLLAEPMVILVCVATVVMLVDRWQHRTCVVGSTAS